MHGVKGCYVVLDVTQSGESFDRRKKEIIGVRGVVKCRKFYEVIC